MSLQSSPLVILTVFRLLATSKTFLVLRPDSLRQTVLPAVLSNVLTQTAFCSIETHRYTCRRDQCQRSRVPFLLSGGKGYRTAQFYNSEDRNIFSVCAIAE